MELRHDLFTRGMSRQHAAILPGSTRSVLSPDKQPSRERQLATYSVEQLP